MILYGLYVGDLLWVAVCLVGTVVGWLTRKMALRAILRLKEDQINGTYFADAFEAFWHEDLRFKKQLAALFVGVMRLLWLRPDAHELENWFNRASITTGLVLFWSIVLTWSSIRSMKYRSDARDDFIARRIGDKKTRKEDGNGVDTTSETRHHSSGSIADAGSSHDHLGGEPGGTN